MILRFAGYEWINKPFSAENDMYLPSCFAQHIHIIAMVNLKKQTRVCVCICVKHHLDFISTIHSNIYFDKSCFNIFQRNTYI